MTNRIYPEHGGGATPNLESVETLRHLQRIGRAVEAWAKRQGINTGEMQGPQRELRDWIERRKRESAA